MVRYFLTLVVLLLSVTVTSGQSQKKSTELSLDNWDVGAVELIPEEKPVVAQPIGKLGKKSKLAKGKPTPGMVAEAAQPKASTPAPGANEASKVLQPGENQPTQFSTGRAELDKLIQTASQENGVDPHLVYSVIRQESGFKPLAVSHKGARGLMQLIPATAQRFGVKNIFDPQENVRGGTRYLRFLLDKFNGDVELALAGYNAGEGAVIKYGYRIPPYNETRNYVSSIMSRYGRANARTVASQTKGGGQVFITLPVVLLSDSGAPMLSNNY